MNYVGRLLGNFKSFYNEINSATLTGAIDVVIVEQEDGSYMSSPFHVRFGKLGVIRAREKVVDIEINGEVVQLHMKLGEAGEAFFVQDVESDEEEITPEMATSPIPSTSEELMARGLAEMKKIHSSNSIDTDTSRARNESENSIRSGSSADIKSLPSRECNKQSPLQESPRRDSFNSSGGLKSANPPSISITDETSSKKDNKQKERKRNRSGDKKKGKHRHAKTDGRKSKQNAKSADTNNQSVKEEVSSIPEFSEDGIFQMDHSGSESDSEVAKISMSSMGRSVSLPVVEATKMEMTDEWASSHYASQCFPFSDGDLTPVISPVGSRPPSPTPFSDSEYERAKYSQEIPPGTELQENISWDWGKLPETHNPLQVAIPGDDSTLHTQIRESDNTEQPSGGLFNFMRQTKKLRHQPEQGGIYLDDLNLDEMDPEVAALYFPKTHTDHIRTIMEEDNESGRGSSAPQSPHSVDGAVGSPHAFLGYGSGYLQDLAMSLCGGLKEADGNLPMDIFMQGLVTFDKLCENPDLLSNPNLVVRMDGKFYNWQIAGPIVMSVAVFHRPLSELAVHNLIKDHMPKKEAARKRGMSSWFSWRRAETVDEEAPKKESQSLPVTPASSPPCSPQKRARDRHSSQNDSTSSDESKEKQIHSKKRTVSPKLKSKSKDKLKKSLRLTSEQIVALNLQPGANDVTFSVTTAYQGTTRCTSNIYLWRYDDKIVISDIDGTITKSDVLGQILPMVGRDWSQLGVVQLFNKIADNGYQFLYLSARAIGQSKVTRDLLRNIRQDDLYLPDGPLLLSPSSLINAFHREVIERKPEEFKIGCLRDIAALFPNRCSFVAGFGNKINDVWSYRAVGIPISRIFSINHRGELRNEYMPETFQSSYTNLSIISDHFFPPLHTNARGVIAAPGNFHEPREYSTFTYWREPLPDLDTSEVDQLVKKDDKKK